MAHHVIYVPGLGDNRAYGQVIILHLWRLFGVRPHYLSLGWEVEQGIEIKLACITKLIDKLHAEGQTVSLVGISAGASAVLAAFAARPEVRRVVTICGKIQFPERIDQHYYDENPDFEGSMARVPDALTKLKTSGRLKDILTMYALRDNVVATDDAQIDGSPARVVGGWNHSSAIFLAIIFGSRRIVKFLTSS